MKTNDADDASARFLGPADERINDEPNAAAFRIAMDFK